MALYFKTSNVINKTKYSIQIKKIVLKIQYKASKTQLTSICTVK